MCIDTTKIIKALKVTAKGLCIARTPEGVLVTHPTLRNAALFDNQNRFVKFTTKKD